MPFTAADATKHTKKADTDTRKEKWASVANSVRDQCLKDGGDTKECDAKAIRVANSQVIEEVSKTEGGEKRPSSDYLVVPDSEKPSTWALPVKKNGKVDHKLMGAAFAALTGGYRGNKYEGPQKTEALRKLKALYKSEKIPLPGEKTSEAEVLREMWDDPEILSIPVPFYAQSFDAVDAMRKAQEYTDKIKADVYIFERLVENIFLYRQMEEEIALEDRRDALLNLFEELEARMFPPRAPVEEVEVVTEKFAESFAGVEIIGEGDPLPGSGPMTLTVVPIRPGWGNKNDKHYYTIDVLKRDAAKFIGAKMYETDHRKEEKSTRTWVSTITKLLGFTEDGAPLTEVVVHNPDFAQRVRNLKEAGLLEKMACSALGEGAFREGKIEGRDAKISESILNIMDVDWVTRAGAGGHAANIIESEEQEMEKTEEGVKTEPTQEQVKKPDPEVVVEFLTEAEVAEALGELTVPREEIKERLTERQYHNVDEIKAQLDKEVAYVKKITESGKPKDLGEEEKPKTKSVQERVAESEQRKNDLATSFFGVRAKKTEEV